MKTIQLCFLALGLASSAFAGPWFRGGAPADPLTEAHQAYLEGDYLTMDLKIKEVLMTPGLDTTTFTNAMALLEKGYEAAGGKLPADWKLPPEIRELKFFERHGRRDAEDTYGLKVTGLVGHVGVVKQLQLVRYPDQVLLDKQRGIGSWSDESDHGEGAEFELHDLDLPKPPADGLYSIHVELEDGKQAEAWFPVSHLLASQVPTVSVPAPGQVFSTGSPRFQFEDFHSPELQPFEWRGLWLAAWGKSTHSAWERYIDDPKVTSVRVGEGGDGASVLAPGHYSFLLGFREMRRFGELRLSRQSFRSVGFSVKP